MLGPPLDVLGQDVWTREAGDCHSRAPGSAPDQQRREERRILRHAGDVLLLLDGDRDPFLVRRRGQRIGARWLFLALLILEVGGETVERGELMGVDGEKMPGAIIETIISGEEDERGGVGRLGNGLRHHHFHLLDLLAGFFHRGVRHRSVRFSRTGKTSSLSANDRPRPQPRTAVCIGPCPPRKLFGASPKRKTSTSKTSRCW